LRAGAIGSHPAVHRSDLALGLGWFIDRMGSRAGGNITGMSLCTSGLHAKRVEVLDELVPAAAPAHAHFNPARGEIKEFASMSISKWGSRNCRRRRDARSWGAIGPAH